MAIFFFGQFFSFLFLFVLVFFFFSLFLGGKPKKVKVSNLYDVDRAVRNCYYFPRCELQQWGTSLLTSVLPSEAIRRRNAGCSVGAIILTPALFFYF
jgi:hypothetical protein